MASGQGSTSNVIAAVCSFFIPGLGQLVQGRLVPAAIMFILAVVVGIFTLGLLVPIVSIVACVEAALWKGPR
jgi:TM2 domain-containing membrane protein YozV